MTTRMRRAIRCALSLPPLCALTLLSACSRDEVAHAEPAVASHSVQVHPQTWPQPSSAVSPDAAIEKKVDALLRSLSVEEKVGQIIQADIGSVTPDDVRRYRLGSVLNGGGSGPGGDDLAPAPVWLQTADAFYLASMDTSSGGHAIPILWGIDAVHGHNNIIGATIFPHNVALGATRNPALMRRIGEITAQEIRVTGQDWTFAPTLAVVQNLRWGRSYESYSQDPALVREYATQIVLGLQGRVGTDFLDARHILATAKHFVGDGGTFDGRDQGDNRSSEEQLRDVHAAGYLGAITAGVQTVMASYSSWHGRKLHGYEDLLTGVLKQRMKFDGFIIGDWNGHGQVSGCSDTSCAIAINAGLDMFMAPDSWRGLYANTLAQVRSGEISTARLDDAVRRILRVKFRAGLFEAGKPSTRPLAGDFKQLGAPEHRAVAREAVRESLVLLKNDRRVLPLRPNLHVLVAGDAADSIAKQSGGWTLTWQGTGTANSQFPNAESIFAAIRSTVIAGGGTATLSTTGTYARRPDVAVVVYGEDPYAETRGDVPTLEYKPGDRSDLDLLQRLRADGVPVVSLFLSGRPLWVTPHMDASDAFVAAWLPGSEAGGIADVLFANVDGTVRYDFAGTLPFAWPRTPTQNPIAPGNEMPLFAHGFGLTYRDATEKGSPPK